MAKKKKEEPTFRCPRCNNYRTENFCEYCNWQGWEGPGKKLIELIAQHNKT